MGSTENKTPEVAQPEMVDAYMCEHSHKYYPVEYVKGWGRTHGKGRGRTPVSIVVDSFHHRPFISSDKHPHGLRLKPVGVTKAALHFVRVPKSEFEANKVILPTSTENRLKISKMLEKSQAKAHKARAEAAMNRTMKEGE